MVPPGVPSWSARRFCPTSPPLCHPTFDDLTDLAHALLHDEPGMQRFAATNRAADLLDDLDEDAVVWERCAQAAGNPAAFQTFR